MNRLNNVGRTTVIAMCAGLVLFAAISLADKFQPAAPAQTCAEQMREFRAAHPLGDPGELLWKPCRSGDDAGRN
jgi:hypothetical protein